MNLIFVIITVTTLNTELARMMEPRTSTPIKRLETINVLASADLPVGINIGPVIPGLNDFEIPSVLKLASERGACFASHTIV